MPDRPLVLITETLDPRCAHWLAERAEVAWVRHDDDAFGDRLPDADALVVRTYTRVDANLLDRAPKLKVVGRAGVGLDNFDLDACRQRGVPVVHTPDANTQAVVEYVLGLMLDRFRPRTPLPPAASAEAFHQLRTTEVGRQLSDLALGIVGMGRIGTRLAVVAHALGMNLYVTDLEPEAVVRKRMAAASPGDGVPFEFVAHDRLYADSDVVTLHADGRPTNRHLLDADALACFKPDALLINAARGMLIDHAALHAWLADHPDAHALLDVHDPEPPPTDSPLHPLANCTLLPHLASRTDTALLNMSWVVRDVAAVLAGDTPRFPAWG
jgi:phosphoglycerate dehydrogenase-like enzyme